MGIKNWNKEIRNKVIAKAWLDDNFKQLLMKNPKAALKEFGIDVSDDFKIQVLEESDNTFYLFLPQAPVDHLELSESELAKMAGGTYDTSGAGQSCDFCSNPDTNC